MKKVEKFLLKNQKEPIYRLAYVQAHGTIDEVIAALDNVITNYKNNFLQNYYHVLQEELKGNLDGMKEYGEKIEKEPYKTYIKAYTLVKTGQLEEAERLILSVQKTFMREELLATIAKIKKNEAAFHAHKNKAIEVSRGIQRYNLIHTFNKMCEKAPEH